MPCVFPVLGIKILGFVNQAGHERGKVVAHGLVFTLGVLLSFWALAAVLAILRAGGDQLGWGFQLQSPAFVFALAVLLLVFALNMSGVFEFGLRATAVGGELQSKSGFAGSFFTGVLATVVATPCSAPFLAPALGAALALSTIESFAIFTAIAIGLSTPYLLLSIFPSAIKILPRPGAWMETFKQFMAFPLYATVGYLIWVLAGQVSEEGLQNLLFALVLIALAIWFYGRWTAPGASAARARFGVVALLAVGATGLWLGWPKPLHAATTASADTDAPDVVWESWSPETVEKLRAEGRIVYVDFTARWCATCQANKKLVFHSRDVLREFAQQKIVTLRADWTNKDPRITAELREIQPLRRAVQRDLVPRPARAEDSARAAHAFHRARRGARRRAEARRSARLHLAGLGDDAHASVLQVPAALVATDALGERRDQLQAAARERLASIAFEQRQTNQHARLTAHGGRVGEISVQSVHRSAHCVAPAVRVDAPRNPARRPADLEVRVVLAPIPFGIHALPQHAHIAVHREIARRARFTTHRPAVPCFFDAPIREQRAEQSRAFLGPQPGEQRLRGWLRHIQTTDTPGALLRIPAHTEPKIVRGPRARNYRRKGKPCEPNCHELADDAAAPLPKLETIHFIMRKNPTHSRMLGTALTGTQSAPRGYQFFYSSRGTLS
ncbi:MAG: thioredoxin family protein [Opitutus sp.]|nr:thioredoxin family protein [Opitutus sp.]